MLLLSRRKETQDAAAGSERRADQVLDRLRSAREPERRTHRLVEQPVDRHAHGAVERARRPAHEQLARRRGDAAVRVVVAELRALVREAPRLERLVARWYVPDRHPLSDFTPEEVARPDLVRREPAPTEPGDPAYRLEVERRQDVEKVVVGDVVDAVEPVDSPQRLAPALAVVAPLHDLGHEQRRVVVAALRPRFEFAALDENPRRRRDAERAIER